MTVKRNKLRVQVDLDATEANLLDLLQRRLSVRSRADLLQQAYGSFLWVVDEMLAGRHVVSVDATELERLHKFKELSVPAVAPSRFNHYRYLVARPGQNQQLYLKGHNMTVGQLIYKMRANDLSVEEAAEDMDLPVEQIMEATVYYHTHKDLIASEAAEEKQQLIEQGVPLEPEDLP